VSKTYRLGKLTVTALDGVSLTVASGEFLAVAGPSGSGKTTLLNLIGCLDTPTSGEVEIDGEPVSALSSGQRADLRARKLGFIFQTFNLIPVLTAYENVEYPLLIHRRGGDVATRVRAALEQVGLADRARHRPTELSGGQQQRVAIARALVSEPALVLADEPTANLDSHTGHDIIELMRRLNRERGTTFVFSTHDPRIMTAADRVLEISDGRIRPEGGHA
jgi:putative ABC transport system ATP-binding protein